MATSADRLTEFESAQKRYQDLIGGQGAFKSLVEQKLGEKTNYNKDLITQQQNLQERNLSLPTQLQQEWSGGVIRDPFAQRALIESRQSNIGSQLGAANALLAARGQEQSKILDTANNNYASQLAGEGTNAQMKYQLYQDALAEEASRRAAAAQANSNAIMEEYYKSLLNGGNTETPQDTAEVETSQYANPKTGANDTSSKILDTLNAVKNAGGNPLDKLAAVYKNSGWSLLNPTYAIGLLTAGLQGKNLNLGNNFVTDSTKTKAAGFSKIWTANQKK